MTGNGECLAGYQFINVCLGQLWVLGGAGVSWGGNWHLYVRASFSGYVYGTENSRELLPVECLLVVCSFFSD